MNSSSNDHYVYELIDPRDHLPFYVGKGKDDRAYWHVKAAKRSGGSGNPYKDHVIHDIQSHSLDVIVRTIASELSEDAAYDLEANLTRIHGLRVEEPRGLLTNLVHGGRGGSENLQWSEERRYQERQRMIGNTLNRGRKQSESEKDARRRALIQLYETGQRIPSAKQLAALDGGSRKRKLSTIEKLKAYAQNRPESHNKHLSQSLKGKTPHNRDVSGVVKDSPETKEKKRKASLGNTPGNKGIRGVVKMSEDAVRKRIESRRRSAEIRGRW